jgi:hypothetical protein
MYKTLKLHAVRNYWVYTKLWLLEDLLGLHMIKKS